MTTWGTPRDLSTWSGPRVADLAWAARARELDVLAAGADVGDRALRELLALQSSDWAFLGRPGTAGEYPRERFAGHTGGCARRSPTRRRSGAAQPGAAARAGGAARAVVGSCAL